MVDWNEKKTPLQLFRVRLSYERGKAWVAMRKWLWVMVVLRLLDWTSRCFSVVEGNSTNTCIHSFSFFVAESPWKSIKQSQTLTICNTNRHCRVGFYTFVLSFVGNPRRNSRNDNWPASSEMVVLKHWFFRLQNVFALNGSIRYTSFIAIFLFSLLSYDILTPISGFECRYHQPKRESV